MCTLHGIGANKGVVKAELYLANSDTFNKPLNSNLSKCIFGIPFPLELDMVFVLKEAKGLICKVGGFTSHGVTIARELGIPCIVGLNEQFDLLSMGCVVTMNGLKGIIAIEE